MKEKMKFNIHLLLLFVSFQLTAMELPNDTEYKVISGPYKGEKILIQGSEDTTKALDKIMYPAETNYFCSLSYEIKSNDYTPAYINAMVGKTGALLELLKQHGYEGTVYSTEINGIPTCLHHSWLEKIEVGEKNE